MEKELNGTEKVEIVASDGNWTIGYVDGVACEWDGNCEEAPERANKEREGSTFGVNYADEYIVIDGRWEENLDSIYFAPCSTHQ